MTLHDRARTDPIAAHAYTLPVVREVPMAGNCPSASSDPHGVARPLAYAADAHAW